MAYYAIGIGGTGAKCLESLIHLAAAGMMPDDKDLYMLFVDPDEANGCLELAVATLNHYKTFNTNSRLAQKSLLRTKIPSVGRPIWTPFGDEGDAQPSLSNFFAYNTLHMSKNKAHAAVARLFEVLYSKEERQEKLDKGFRGHPSIGASVMAKTVKLGQGEPWKTFRILVAKDTDAKVFLAGSIFGGTGASGFPTVAELVKNEFPNVSIGGALVLPYFTFTDTETNKKGYANNAEANNELKAEAEYFLMNTQAALKYYHLWNKKLIYDAIYLFGDESQIEFDASLGGPEQRNAPHFIELYAALAAIHFFGNFEKPDGAAGAQYFMTARGQDNSLQWKDLPDGSKGEEIRSKINQLTHFSFAYLSVYQPMLEDIRQNGSGYRAPWYIDFFEQNNISLEKVKPSLDNVTEYCQDFLLWLANIQNSSDNNDLAKYEAYAHKPDGKTLELKKRNEFVLEAFGNLVSPYKSESLLKVNKLWEDMCLAKGKGDGPGDVGKFIATLYQKCATV